MATILEQQRSQRQFFATLLFVAQVLMSLVTWIGAWLALESIIVTGPLLSAIGLVLAIAVRTLGSWIVLLFGLSAPIVAAIGAFTIAAFHLGPGEAQQPILVIVGVYILLMLPVAIFARVQILRWPAHACISVSRGLRFSIKSLLILMTAVAIVTALIGSIVKHVYDFPIFFSSFGIAMLLLTGIVAWRFYIRRQRMLQLPERTNFSNVLEWLEAQFARLIRIPGARCSFCGRTDLEAAPFAEGRDGSLICGSCAGSCGKLIADTLTRSTDNHSEIATNSELG